MRNYQGRWGELDLVVRDGDTLVFVEVKSRGPSSWGRPAEAVEQNKRRRIILTAQAYLQELLVPEPPVRFDIVEVVLETGVLPKVTWLKAAFMVGER